MASSFEPLFQSTSAAIETSSGPARADASQWLNALGARGGFAPTDRFDRRTSGIANSRETEAQTALAEAYAQGEAAGRAAARDDLAREDHARQGLKLSVQRLDGQLREQFEERVAETVVALCESVLAPMAIDREALQRRCVDAACMVGEGITDATLRLHPDDEALLDRDFAATWHILLDPDLERGTVMFDMAEGAVRDGPGEWRMALREAMGLC